MRRGILVLSGLLVVVAGAALVHWAAGFPAILPWPILFVVLAMGGGGFVIGMMREQPIAESKTASTARPRVLKKHRPRGRAKKRVVRNAMKRRRFRKMPQMLVSQDGSIVHPGGEQVGFFG